MAFQQAVVLSRGAVHAAPNLRARKVSNSGRLAGSGGHAPFNPLRMIPRPSSRMDFSVTPARAGPVKAAGRTHAVQCTTGGPMPPSRVQHDGWWRGVVGGMVMVPALFSAMYAPRTARADVPVPPGVTHVVESSQQARHVAKGHLVEHFAVAEAAIPKSALQELLNTQEAKFAATLGVVCLMAFLTIKFMKSGPKATPTPKDEGGADSISDDEKVLLATMDPVQRQNYLERKRSGKMAAPAAAAVARSAPAKPPAAWDSTDDQLFDIIDDPVERARMREKARRAVLKSEVGSSSPKPVALQPLDESDFDLISDPVQRAAAIGEARASGKLNAKGKAPPPAPAPAGPIDSLDESDFNLISDPVQRAQAISKARTSGKLDAKAKAPALPAPPASAGAIDLSFIDDPLERQRLAMQISASGGTVTGVGGPRAVGATPAGVTPPVTNGKPGSAPAGPTGTIDLSFIDDPLERQRLAMQITASGGTVSGAGGPRGVTAPAPAPPAPPPAVAKGKAAPAGDVFDVIDDPVERARLRAKANAKAESAKLASSAAELSERLAPEVAEIIRKPAEVPESTRELQDAVVVSSAAVVEEEIDLSFIPDIIEREKLQQKIAARRAAATPAAPAPSPDPKMTAVAELAASAKELSGRLAPDVAAITAETPVAESSEEVPEEVAESSEEPQEEVGEAGEAVDPSVFDMISDPVERAAAIDKAKAAGRYAAPTRPSGAARSMPPGSTLAYALPPPGGSAPGAGARLAGGPPPPPPPPLVPKTKKKWWKKLRGWRVAVSRKEAIEFAMKAAAEKAVAPKLQFDQGSAGLSLKGATAPKARKVFPQVLARASPRDMGEAPVAPTPHPAAPAPAPAAAAQKKKFDAAAFFMQQSIDQARKATVPPKYVPADVSRPLTQPPPPPPVMPAAVQAAAEPKLDSTSGPIVPAAPKPAAPAPPPAPESPVVAEVSSPASEFPIVAEASSPSPSSPSMQPRLSTGAGPITPAGGSPPPARPFTPGEPTYVVADGPLRPVAAAVKPPAPSPPPAAVPAAYVTDKGPIVPVGLATLRGPAPAVERTLSDGPGPIFPAGVSRAAPMPAPYVNTVASLSSANGPIVPADASRMRAPFTATLKSWYVTDKGPIVPVGGGAREATPLPTIKQLLVSNAGPVRPASGVPPVWPRPPVVQRITSDGGPLIPAGRPARTLPEQIGVVDGGRASISAGPGPVVPAMVRKMLGALDLSPKFSKWAPSLEAGKASWGERPLMPMKPAGFARGTGYGKASWSAERAQPGAPVPGAKMPGMPAEGSTKATIYVGPGPLVAAGTGPRGSEPQKLLSKVAARSDEKDDDEDDNKKPPPPSPPPPSPPPSSGETQVKAASAGAAAALGGVPTVRAAPSAAAASPLMTAAAKTPIMSPASPPGSPRPVGGLESGWLTNLIMGNRKYGMKAAAPAAAQSSAGVVETQDGSSPYLAKTEGTVGKSAGGLRTGFKKVFGRSGSLSQALTPGSRRSSTQASSLRGVVGSTAPRGPPAGGKAGAPPAGVPTPPSPPADPVRTAFSVTSPRPTASRGVASGAVSSVPAVVKRDGGRVDPATYLTGDVTAARESILATQAAALKAGQSSAGTSRLTAFPITDFTSDDESDVEEAPLPVVASSGPRKTTGASPVLAALGLFAAAAQALSPFWKTKEEIAADKAAARARAAAPRNRDLATRAPAKYDLFAELLTSVAADQKLKGGEEWSAVRWLTDMVPEKGVQKFDVLRIFIRGLVEAPSAKAAPSKYDMVWDLLKESRETGVGANKRYDPVYALLHNAALAADWGLPQKDPVRDLLRVRDSDWEPSKYDPVAAFFNSGAGWHGNPRPKWDPVQAVLLAQPPQGQAWLDPVGDMLRRAKTARSAPAVPKTAALPQLAVGRPSAVRDGDEPPSGPPASPQWDEKPIVVDGTPSFSPPAAPPKTLVGGSVMASSTTPVLPPAPSSVTPVLPTAAAPSVAGALPSGEPTGALPALPVVRGPPAGALPAVGAPARALLAAGALAAALPAQGVGEAKTAMTYDPVPDLIRLQGARGSGAGYDPVVVIVRRGGGLDFMDAATSFRELLEDEALSRKYGGMYAMLLNSQAARLGAPASMLARIPSRDRGLFEGALQSVEGLLSDITDKYPKLYRMLRGRAGETVVDAMCALAALVQSNPSFHTKAA